MTSTDHPHDAGTSRAGAVPARAPFGDRLAGAVAARESQVVLGLDPDPQRLWPGAVEAAPATPGRRPSAPPPPCRALPRRHRRRRAGLRRGQAAARLLRAPRRARLGGAAGDGRARARRRACSCSPTASAATSPSRPPPTGRRSSARRRRRSATSRGLGADAFTASPYLGVDTLEACWSSAARDAARRRRSCSCAPRTRAPPTSRTSSSRAAGRCGPAWRRSSTASARQAPGDARAARRRRRRRRDRARAHRAPARAHAAHAVPAARHRRAGRARRGPRAGLRARPRRRPGRPRRGRSSPRTRRPAARRPTPRAPRPSACARRPGPLPSARAWAGRPMLRRAPCAPQPRSLAGPARPDGVRPRGGRRARRGPAARGARRRACLVDGRRADDDGRGRRREHLVPRARRTASRSGDTLTSISMRTGVPLERLRAAQPRGRLRRASDRRADQASPVIRVPGTRRAPAAAALAALLLVLAVGAAAPGHGGGGPAVRARARRHPRRARDGRRRVGRATRASGARSPARRSS